MPRFELNLNATLLLCFFTTAISVSISFCALQSNVDNQNMATTPTGKELKDFQTKTFYIENLHLLHFKLTIERQINIQTFNK